VFSSLFTDRLKLRDKSGLLLTFVPIFIPSLPPPLVYAGIYSVMLLDLVQNNVGISVNTLNFHDDKKNVPLTFKPSEL
jgi:hypothetical protein